MCAVCCVLYVYTTCQVIPGQDFEVEWVNGHGDQRPLSDFMFATVHEDDLQQLAAKNITGQQQQQRQRQTGAQQR